MTDPAVPERQQYTSLRAALSDALDETPHKIRDRALIALAYRYADMIDDAQDRAGEADDDDQARNFGRMVAVVAKIGPRLEATLNALGMAPGARPAVRGAEPHADPGTAALGQLESGATPAGLDLAAAVDPAVTEADT